MKTAGAGLLDRIIEVKKREVSLLNSDLIRKAAETGLSAGRFREAVTRKEGRIRIIAETKKASPSRGLLQQDYSAGRNALLYKEAGADAVSVLTDSEFFSGSLADLKDAVRSGLPVIRKDFIISELQIAEAALCGAAAVLLIVRILTPAELKRLLVYAESLGLDVLTETHNEAEILTALEAGAGIIGINHRDLDTLNMDLSMTATYAPLIRSYGKDILIVAESGIESREGLLKVEPYADAALIGHLFMQKENPKEAWKELFGEP